MRIFVAGATGVLGRRTVPLLLAAGHDVSALARTPQRRALVLDLGARPVAADLFEPGSLGGVVADHDVVCNLATHIPPIGRMALPGAWSENDRIRTEASRNLVDAALSNGVARFVQESIAFLYRDGGDGWLDESSPIDPVAHVRSAAVAESNVARFTDTGAAGVILRFAAFYGPDSDTTLATIRLARRRIALGAAPDAYMSSVTTDDAAAAVAAAITAPAGIYNVGDDEPLTRRAYFAALADALGVAPPLIAPAGLAKLGGPTASVLTRSQRVSNHRLAAASAWKPAHRSVREGWPAVIAAAESGRHGTGA